LFRFLHRASFPLPQRCRDLTSSGPFTIFGGGSILSAKQFLENC
jgi:hypothetical protein